MSDDPDLVSVATLQTSGMRAEELAAAIDRPAEAARLEGDARDVPGGDLNEIRFALSEDSALGVEPEVVVILEPSAPVLVGAGDIAGCGSAYNDEATAALLDGIEGTVFTAGDNVYLNGTDAEFRDCYDPAWGRHKARTYPAPGNHEYVTPGAAGYYNYFGAAAGDQAKGYYSYDLGSWHVIVLNTECAEVGGCTSVSTQGQWLAADLADHPAVCTLAYWHRPRFSSSVRGGDPSSQEFWQLLYEAGVDVVVSGHEHHYERFGPQDPSGRADPGRGIRQFVVGTGGAPLRGFAQIVANSEVQSDAAHGVLKLTLNARGYDWEFIPVAGASFTDSGSDTCFTANEPPAATITAPSSGARFILGDAVTFTGTSQDLEDGDLTGSLLWASSLDGPIGSGGSFVTSTLSLGEHLVNARATDAGGLTASEQILVTVERPPIVRKPSVPVTLAGSASDSLAPSRARERP